MLRPNIHLYSLLIICILCGCKEDCDNCPKVGELITRNVDMSWWNDARYGMFIHYGIYSVLGGEYIGENTDGIPIHFQSAGNNNSILDTVKLGTGAGAEWILYEASIPRASYRKYASSFTAEKFDPQAIVDLAITAGMKYIILTAKHHDGFCLWNSDATEWNVSNTPAGFLWKNDLIAPLIEATRAAGLKFGIYFSHTRDWMHQGGIGPIPELKMKEYSYFENKMYMETYTYPMVSELLNRYRPDIFWWDSNNPYEEFAARCNSLVINSSPTIIQNNRISTLPQYQGDFDTPEQSMNENEGHQNVELCMTLNNSWGYNQFDDDWKEPEYILWCLLRANKLGGNLLLNVGPQSNGTIPERCQSILKKVGQWINENSSGIYYTRKSPLKFNLPYGPTTWRTIESFHHLYYHIFYWDGSGELWLPGIMSPAHEIELSFPADTKLKFNVELIEGIGLHITGLPKIKFSEMCTTLDIKFKKEPIFDEGTRENNNTIYLDALGAQIENVAIDDFETKPCINWYSGRCISYKVAISRAGTYKISSLLAGYHPGTITMNFNNTVSLTGKNKATYGFENFEWQELGNIFLNPGKYVINVKADQVDLWLKIRGFKLERQS